MMRHMSVVVCSECCRESRVDVMCFVETKYNWESVCIAKFIIVVHFAIAQPIW